LIGKKFDVKEFLEAVEAKRLGWSKDLKALTAGELPDFGFVEREIASEIEAGMRGSKRS
jgi:hypothetical protein